MIKVGQVRKPMLVKKKQSKSKACSWTPPLPTPTQSCCCMIFTATANTRLKLDKNVFSFKNSNTTMCLMLHICSSFQNCSHAHMIWSFQLIQLSYNHIIIWHPEALQLRCERIKNLPKESRIDCLHVVLLQHYNFLQYKPNWWIFREIDR